jgi:flagellar biosynthesis chaperone FliJ
MKLQWNECMQLQDLFWENVNIKERSETIQSKLSTCLQEFDLNLEVLTSLTDYYHTSMENIKEDIKNQIITVDSYHRLDVINMHITRNIYEVKNNQENRRGNLEMEQKRENRIQRLLNNLR